MLHRPLNVPAFAPLPISVVGHILRRLRSAAPHPLGGPHRVYVVRCGRVDPVDGKVIGKNDPNAFELLPIDAAPSTDETLITVTEVKPGGTETRRTMHRATRIRLATVLESGPLDLGTIGNGTPNVVGLRFDHVGIPAKSNIIAAFIQFTAFQDSPPDADANLEIDAVLVPHALPFATDTDLQNLPADQCPVRWPAERWNDPLGAKRYAGVPDDARTSGRPGASRSSKSGFHHRQPVAFIINGAITAPGAASPSRSRVRDQRHRSSSGAEAHHPVPGAEHFAVLGGVR